MSEHAPKRRLKHHVVPGPVPLDDHGIGEEALHFTRWFVKSKYHLMGGFLGELGGAPRDPERVRERFGRALHHAHRVHQVRGVVTLLLALGVVAAAAGAVLNLLGADPPTRLLASVVALSTSASVLLVAVRLLLDRYLDRCDVAATFLAIELAVSASARASPPQPARPPA